MIEGAHAVLRHLDPNSQQPDDRRLLRWINRYGRKGAAIRLANRNFRIVWAMLQSQQGYCRRPQHKAQPCLMQEIRRLSN